MSNARSPYYRIGSMEIRGTCLGEAFVQPIDRLQRRRVRE